MLELDEAAEGVMTQAFINDMIHDMDLANSMIYLLETRNCAYYYRIINGIREYNIEVNYFSFSLAEKCSR